jgi:hypothetical protein
MNRPNIPIIFTIFFSLLDIATFAIATDVRWCDTKSQGCAVGRVCIVGVTQPIVLSMVRYLGGRRWERRSNPA